MYRLCTIDESLSRIENYTQYKHNGDINVESEDRGIIGNRDKEKTYYIKPFSNDDLILKNGIKYCSYRLNILSSEVQISMTFYSG